MVHSFVKSPVRLTISWTVATTVGYLLGGVVIVQLANMLFDGFLLMSLNLAEIESGSSDVVLQFGYLALMGAAFGLTVSTCQWPLLRQIQGSAAQWLIVSGLGTALAFVITPLICMLIVTNSTTVQFRLGCQGPYYSGFTNPLEFNPVFTGAIVGAVQWIYLQRWLPLAGLWIPATAISGYLLSGMYTLAFGAIMSLVCAVGVPFFFVFPSLVTALLLGWLWAKSEAYSEFMAPEI